LDEVHQQRDIDVAMPTSGISGALQLFRSIELIHIMLTQLVNLLENKANGLSLSEISRALNAQPSAVLSMLQLLVQKGKLIEIGPDGKSCTACDLQSECNLLAARGTRYACNSRSPAVHDSRMADVN